MNFEFAYLLYKTRTKMLLLTPFKHCHHQILSLMVYVTACSFTQERMPIELKSEVGGLSFVCEYHHPKSPRLSRWSSTSHIQDTMQRSKESPRRCAIGICSLVLKARQCCRGCNQDVSCGAKHRLDDKREIRGSRSSDLNISLHSFNPQIWP
jgi:hypothetical protein